MKSELPKETNQIKSVIKNSMVYFFFVHPGFSFVVSKNHGSIQSKKPHAYMAMFCRIEFINE